MLRPPPPPQPLPPWLAPPADLAGREPLVAGLVARIHVGPCRLWLTGPPGVGLTSVAAAVAAAVAEVGELPVRAARLTPCRSPDDLLLTLGEALGAVPPGDEGAVAAALGATAGLLVVLDDADLPEPGTVIEDLSALAPGVRWLLTGRRAPAQAEALTLEPSASLPPAAQIPPGRSLPAKAELLAIQGGSLPGAMDLPAALLVPMGDGRQALRRSVAEALRGRAELDPSRVAAEALPDLEALLGLATGAPLRAGFQVDDALVLRWVSEVLAEPDAACRAAAAAARLLAALGQPAGAHAVLDAADRRNTRARPATRALVAWARGDLRLSSGEEEAAERAWAQARSLLQGARDPVLLAALLRRQADALAARGQARQAATRYREARALHVQLDDPAGVAATVRGAADLAVARGEVLSAEMLYDEADATAAGIVELSNRRVGRAGLALAQGDLGRARSLLAEPEFAAVTVPLLEANRQRRLAELALREGRHAQARAAGLAAARAYARLGETAAQGHTTRLLGDVAAAQGQLTEAAACWQRALELQVRCRDLAGLRRTLHHAAALEQEAGSPAVAAELRDAAAALAFGAGSRALGEVSQALDGGETSEIA